MTANLMVSIKNQLGFSCHMVGLIYSNEFSSPDLPSKYM